MIDVTASNTNLATGLANTGSHGITHAAWTSTIPIAQTFKVQGTNTHSVSFNTTYSVNWQWRIYFGESTTLPLVESDIVSLRASGLVSTFARTYPFLATGYKYICYPASMGTATNFTDTGTSLNVPFQSPYTVSVTNINGVVANYNVHRSTNILGSAINILVS